MDHSDTVKKRIIFVDDDIDILHGLKRMLRNKRNEWKMAFAKSGQEALDILSKEKFEVIVSDMIMPGMDGAQLLTQVMGNWPDMVRIVLSGHSKQNMIYKSLRSAHQYLSKPCDHKILLSTVERAFSLRSFLANESLQQVVGRLGSLPSLPALITDLTNVLKSPNSSLSKVEYIISKDACMTAKILQLVNSPFFGIYPQITNLSQAVTLLGIDKIRALVTSVHVFSELKQKKIGQIAIEDQWDHFSAVSIVCREIVKMELDNSKLNDLAFISGILHDIGKVVLLSNFPEKYQKAIALAEKERMSLTEAEREIFKATHAEVGGYLLGLWGLPDSIVEGVFYHHCPSKSAEREFGIITAVHVANSLVAEEIPAYKTGELSPIDYSHIEKIGKTDRISVWEKKCHTISNWFGGL